jgi:hypothetical protein
MGQDDINGIAEAFARMKDSTPAAGGLDAQRTANRAAADYYAMTHGEE